METLNNATPQKSKKKINDFIWLFIGITVVVLALYILKMLMQEFNLVQ